MVVQKEEWNQPPSSGKDVDVLAAAGLAFGEHHAAANPRCKKVVGKAYCIGDEDQIQGQRMSRREGAVRVQQDVVDKPVVLEANNIKRRLSAGDEPSAKRLRVDALCELCDSPLSSFPSLKEGECRDAPQLLQQRHNPVQSATDQFAPIHVHLQMEGLKEELRSAQEKLRRLQMQVRGKEEEYESRSLHNRARYLPVPVALSLPHLPPLRDVLRYPGTSAACCTELPCHNGARSPPASGSVLVGLNPKLGPTRSPAA